MLNKNTRRQTRNIFFLEKSQKVYSYIGAHEHKDFYNIFNIFRFPPHEHQTIILHREKNFIASIKPVFEYGSFNHFTETKIVDWIECILHWIESIIESIKYLFDWSNIFVSINYLIILIQIRV